MNDFLNEIKQEVREEKALLYIKRHFPAIAIFCVVLIAIFSLYSWYDGYMVDKANEESAIYGYAIKKAKSGNIDDAMKKFQTLESSNTAFGASALLHLCMNAYVKKDFDLAIEYLKKIETNPKYHVFFHHLALLFKAEIVGYHRNNYNNAIDLLNTYIENPNAMFKHLAQERIICMHLKNGNKAKAKEIILKAKVDPMTPENILLRIASYETLVSQGK